MFTARSHSNNKNKNTFYDNHSADNNKYILYDRHATWVGMLIGGRNGGAVQGDFQTGIAMDTDLRSGAIGSSWSGPAYTQNFDFTLQSFNKPFVDFFGTADVINTSWAGGDPTGTNVFAVAIDGLANSFPSTTYVNIAGNAGPGTNTVGWPGSGYNAITVGALQNDGANVYDSVAAFSSRGPQDYSDPVNGVVAGVRAAVDLAAPGTDLTTAYYGGQTGGNNPTLSGSPSGPAGASDSYSDSIFGSSLAAPITAGGAALIASASYNTPALGSNPASRDARVVKSVLLNSADKIPGWSNGQVPHVNGLGGVQTTQSLDYASGAGRLNLDRAFDQYYPDTNTRDVPGTTSGSHGMVRAGGWDFGNVQNGIDNVYYIEDQLEAGTELDVTLAWFRERSYNTNNSQTFDTAQADLNLVVRDTNTGNIISESSSTYNVVEHLSFDLPATSLYQLEVHHSGNVFGPITSEDYGLAWSGAVIGNQGQVPLTPSSVIGGSASINDGGSLWDSTDPGGQEDGFNGTNITDGDLSEDGFDSFWAVNASAEDPAYLVIDLGDTYNIDQINLYNTHNRTANNYGTADFRIDASNSIFDTGPDDDYDLSGTIETILTGTLSDTAGEDPITTVDSFTSITPHSEGSVRYLKFVAISGIYANNDLRGLNEIEVFFDPNATSADFDENSFVNGHDFLIWQRGYDPSCTTCTLGDGDADYDQDVDGDDLAIWQGQFGSSSTVSTAELNAAVPEPHTGLLLLTSLAIVSTVTCRRTLP